MVRPGSATGSTVYPRTDGRREAESGESDARNSGESESRGLRWRGPGSRGQQRRPLTVARGGRRGTVTGTLAKSSFDGQGSAVRDRFTWNTNLRILVGPGPSHRPHAHPRNVHLHRHRPDRILRRAVSRVAPSAHLGAARPRRPPERGQRGDTCQDRYRHGRRCVHGRGCPGNRRAPLQRKVRNGPSCRGVRPFEPRLLIAAKALAIRPTLWNESDVATPRGTELALRPKVRPSETQRRSGLGDRPPHMEGLGGDHPSASSREAGRYGARAGRASEMLRRFARSACHRATPMGTAGAGGAGFVVRACYESEPSRRGTTASQRSAA
jgi:hypothetical protein